MSLRFFSNKHVITAFIVAPLLAVMGYMVADKMVSEKPLPAQEGQSYPLLAGSNCRYTSGVCDLRNNDFRARIAIRREGDQALLVLSSEQILENIVFSVSRMGDVESLPNTMVWNSTVRQWEAALPYQPDDNTQLKLVLNSAGVNYYAETPMTFSTYQTGFEQPE